MKSDFISFINEWAKFFPQSKNILSIKRHCQDMRVLIVSPHPDDECLLGGLALRLQLENKAQVFNVACTLGSNPKYFNRRKKELNSAVKKLKFKNFYLPHDWSKKKTVLKKIIQKVKPDVVITCHPQDLHPTHIKTSQLTSSVLKEISYSGFLFWGEFWKSQNNPSLLVEISSSQCQTLVTALSLHKGEIARNPYHLRLPAWLMDNVRRGSELLSGAGSEAAKFPFGLLYSFNKVSKGKISKMKISDRLISLHSDLSDLLQK